MTSIEAELDDLRQRGNHEFSLGSYDNALSLYSAAIEKLAIADIDNATTVVSEDLQVALYCNRSASYFQMEAYEESRDDAERAWKIAKQKAPKAAYRLAKAYTKLHEFELAKTVIQEGIALLTQQDNDQRKGFEALWNQVLQEALQVNANRSGGTPRKETSIQHVQRPISIREFDRGTVLGYGNFSEIVIVTHKETKEKFALKIIEKKQAADLAKRQHPNVFNEINMERRVLLERLPTHKNIIQMFHAFQDYNNLFYLMQLHTEWSDLWSEIRYENKMVGCHRSQAKIWLYELIDALEHMHKHGIVHRDLKAENILLDRRGHVIVIDFGTAKDLIQTDLNGPEFVGTPDFMSPEAVEGTGGMEEAAQAFAKGEFGAIHTADLYAFGAIAFILQTGQTPYWSASPYLAFLKIKRGNLVRPTGIIDDDCWDLIQSLMRVEPSKRLGAEAFVVEQEKREKRMKMADGGYNMIREHPYFAEVHDRSQQVKEETPIPSLRDLCYRSVAKLAQNDSVDLSVCDAHPPGDGSSHDLLRLSQRDRDGVMHVLDRLKLLRDPRIYARFFSDANLSRIDKVRPRSRDFVGLTQMNDDQGKPPKAMLNDPDAKPIEKGPIKFVIITNPLFVQDINEKCDDDTRKQYIKLLKKSISAVNRARPKMVVAAGYIDEKCRKLLARVSESIPTVVHDGSSFFTFWLLGVQCLAIQAEQSSESSDQMAWIREHMEICRMSKHPLFVLSNGDPRRLSARFQKRLARGRSLCLFGGIDDEDPYDSKVQYEANEVVDDISIKSTDSQEDYKDEFGMRVLATRENGLWSIQVYEEADQFDISFENIGE